MDESHVTCYLKFSRSQGRAIHVTYNPFQKVVSKNDLFLVEIDDIHEEEEEVQ